MIEFNMLYLLIALVVFLFYLKMKRRERTWIIGMVSHFHLPGTVSGAAAEFPFRPPIAGIESRVPHVIARYYFDVRRVRADAAGDLSWRRIMPLSRRIFMVIGLCIVDMAVVHVGHPKPGSV